MTGAELKEALYTRCPVIAHTRDFGDVRYKYVEEIVYRRGGFLNHYRVILTVGLMDYCGHSITYTAAKNVRKDEEAQKNTADAGNIDCELKNSNKKPLPPVT